MINLADGIINKMGDEVVDKISKILEKNAKKGLTITELVKLSKFSRSAIRTALAKLDGAEKVIVRKIGMAKVYLWRGSE